MLGRFFSHLISLIIGSFFLLLGLFCLAFPWSSHLQQEVARLLSEHTLMLSLFGLGFLLIGLSLMSYTFMMTRHSYLTVRTGKLSVKIDEAVVYQYLETYWKEQFPDAHVPFAIQFKKNALQICPELPYLPLNEQKAFLEKVKEDFTDLFGRLLGYPHDVCLVASFQSEKKTNL